MPLPGENSLPGRWVAPLPLLVGAALGFLGCTLAGRALSRVNSFHEFSRFHTYIDYQSLYYPTVTQVRTLARRTLQPGKVAVVLGGNSVLQGFGQGAVGNWTNRLQELLGDRFQVLNLAQGGGNPFEFGATAAEMLCRDHPRLLFVTNTWPGPVWPPGDPDGKPPLRYFFWQARARGFLQPNPEREARLHELEKNRDEAFRELKRQCVLDARLDVHDLWNVVTYRYASTVWCSSLRSPWLRPRRVYPDPDCPLPPADEATLQRWCASVVPGLRGNAAVARELSLSPTGGAQQLASLVPPRLRECLAPCLRGRTLVLLNHHCPYYLSRLTAEERAWFLRSFDLTSQVYARAGVRAAEVGRGLEPRHYSDRVHLTVAGGRRLAEEVAPLVRALAEERGYILAVPEPPPGRARAAPTPTPTPSCRR